MTPTEAAGTAFCLGLLVRRIAEEILVSYFIEEGIFPYILNIPMQYTVPNYNFVPGSNIIN